jgi:colicin import membrane protein
MEALEKRSRAEDDRWEKERERLQAALRRTRIRLAGTH